MDPQDPWEVLDAEDRSGTRDQEVVEDASDPKEPPETVDLLVYLVFGVVRGAPIYPYQYEP